MLRRAWLVCALVATLGCRSSDSTPPAERSERVESSAVQHTDHERVRAIFPPIAQQVLLEADTLELFSLICERAADEDEQTLGEQAYVVRSRVDVAPKDRVSILSALYGDVAAGENGGDCFEPHHALRARKGKQELLIVICYQCDQLVVYEGSEQVGWAPIGSEGEAVLNRVLGQARSVPANEVMGRTAAYWAAQAKARLAGKPDAPAGEGYERAINSLQVVLLTRDDPEALALVREVFALRYAQEPAETAYLISEAIEQTRHLSGRQAAVELATEVARASQGDDDRPETLTGIAASLFDLLLEDPQPDPEERGRPQSTELREAAAKALKQFTWLPADLVLSWITQAKEDVEDTKQRDALLELLGSLGKN